MFHQDLSKIVDRILSNEAPRFDLVKKLINKGAIFNPQRVLDLFYRTETINGSEGIWSTKCAYYPDHYLEWIDLLMNANALDTQHPVYKDTILMWATERRESELVERLLQAQANPNLTNDNGETALHIAVRNNHPACVNLLLAAGTDPSTKNKADETALEIAAKKYHLECIELLLAITVNSEEKMIPVKPK